MTGVSWEAREITANPDWNKTTDYRGICDKKKRDQRATMCQYTPSKLIQKGGAMFINDY